MILKIYPKDFEMKNTVKMF